MADFSEKSFHVVEDGLRVMPKLSFEWETVSDKQAVMVGDNIFCTKRWFAAYISKGKVDKLVS